MEPETRNLQVERAATSDPRIHNGILVTEVDLSVMSERSLLAALHRLTGRAEVVVDAASPTVRRVTIRPRGLMTDLRELAWDLHRVLLDETLREKIRTETAPIRAVLIAQAFSRTNLLHSELDEVDPANHDPLGISVPDRQKHD